MKQNVCEGKTVVVTGSAGGIGLAIAEAFAREGANVVISDIRAKETEEVSQSLREKGLSVKGFPANAADEEDLKNLFSFAMDEFHSLDVVVNNAGVQHIANIEDFPVDKFRSMIDLMLIGPFLSIKHAFPIMKRQNYGRIVNVASINGLIGFSGKAAYNSAKHGVVGLTKVAALEGATAGITVNTLCPGYVDTPMIRNQLADLAQNRGVSTEDVLKEVIYPLVPQNRLLSPAEVADYAVYLASDYARGVTGQAVVVDGGYVAQ